MKDKELADLRRAVQLLENPGLGARIANLLGTPIEKAISLLPRGASDTIGAATQKAIYRALKLSLKTLEPASQQPGEEPPEASDGWHLAAAALTGAAGGALGMVALTIELPISTVIMMRSIADVARSEGADLQDLATQLECVQVLAFGGNSPRDDATEIGYFIAREAMAKAAAEAATHLAQSGLQKEAAPAIVRWIATIAERYSLTVTEKAAAQLIPVVGAIGGALINTVFIDHFQNMARGHFIVRRLEKTYGSALVRRKYLEFK